MNQELLDVVKTRPGFIAALDQSGGSTPKALKLYGVDEDAYSNEDEMFDRIHEMRTRIITSPAFNGDRILGAILFEMTMDREIERQGHGASTCGSVKQVVPFLKVDKGLADEVDGAQVMKPMPDLDALLRPRGRQGRVRHEDALGHQARERGRRRRGRRPAVRGRHADPRSRPRPDHRARGRHQQPDEGGGRGAAARRAILEHAQRPRRPTSRHAEAHAARAPTTSTRELVEHPQVLKVVALSGGYTRDGRERASSPATTA